MLTSYSYPTDSSCLYVRGGLALSSTTLEVVPNPSPGTTGSTGSSTSTSTSITSSNSVASSNINPGASPGAGASLTLQEILHLLGIYSRAAPMHGLGE